MIGQRRAKAQCFRKSMLEGKLGFLVGSYARGKLYSFYDSCACLFLCVWEGSYYELTVMCILISKCIGGSYQFRNPSSCCVLKKGNSVLGIKPVNALYSNYGLNLKFYQ